jgi:sulfur relay (sulfurtransferase) DsrC/TusE family protein
LDFSNKKNLITEKNLINGLINFSHDNDNIKYAEDAFKRFFGSLANDIEYEISDAEEAIFVSWYIFDYKTTKGDRMIDLYLKAYDQQLSHGETHMLNLWNKTHVSIYEVISVNSGSEVLLEDIYTANKLLLEDKNFVQRAKKWELALVRIIPVGESYHFAGASTRFLPMEKSSLLKYGKNKFKSYQKRNKEATWEDFMRNESLSFFKYADRRTRGNKRFGIYNLEGEELVFCKAFYRVNDFKDILIKLKGSPSVQMKDINSLEKMEFLWVEHEKILGTIILSRGKMTLECHNRGLLSQGKEVLETIGGQSLSYQLDIYQDPIHSLKKFKPANLTLNHDEIKAYLEDYFGKWVTTPVTLFDGKTPLEAVKYKKGREKLIELLKQMEHFSEIAKEQGEPFVDVSKIKDRLGIVF